MNAQLMDLQDQLEAEKARKEGFKIENERRKHNYIPFILELLKISSERGELSAQLEKAKAAGKN